MPRKIDPSKIKVGHGLAASDSVEVNALVPSGAGAAPAGLTTHVQDDHNAHPAHAVSIDNVPDTYNASHVEGALDELSALVPPRPPALGKGLEFMGINMLPDWGILKLDDGPISQRVPSLNLDWDNDIQKNGAAVYPYYWNAFHITDFETQGMEWRRQFLEIENNDPKDPHFNTHDASYLGGGSGTAHIGEFRRELDDGGVSTQTTHCIIPSSGPAGGKKVVVSGVVYPADRGTLALIRCCPGGELEEICHDVDLLKRCLAAINLGQGILDKCDGDPGGIFTLGEAGGDEAPASTNPYSFPGRATGQYNLEELHTGEYAHYMNDAGNDLPAPFDDADEDGNKGWNYAGQVRLGTDPNAGVAVIANGIPILGGGSHARGGGHDQNFLAYRLPYMDDYSLESGLRFTPAAEKGRFSKKPAVPGGDTTTFGEYPNFDKEYWTWQIARYRHQFSLTDDIILEGEPRESGTYLLIHFKKEEYFEALVRDGVWPTNDQIYSQNLYNTDDVEDTDNKANNSAKNGEPRPGYDVLRRVVFEDPSGRSPCQVISSNATIRASQEIDLFQTISGVKYFPGSGGVGKTASRFSFDFHFVFGGSEDVDDGSVGLWENSWRNNGYENQVINPLEDRTKLTSETPVILGVGAFTGAKELATHSTLVNLSHAHEWVMSWGYRFRDEHIGLSSRDLSNHLADTPLATDVATIKSGQLLIQGGDYRGVLPKFSTQAAVRIFHRRPLTHLSASQGFDPNTAEVDAAIHISHRVPVNEMTSGGEGLNLLFHGSTTGNAGYGNLLNGGEPITTLQTSIKDAEERFLDEVYRWRSDFTNPATGKTPETASNMEQLIGPGLPHGPVPIKVPVRKSADDVGTNAMWQNACWLYTQSHENSLAGVENNHEAQVAGLPDRNPSVLEGVTSSQPSNGILMYPQKNYNVGYTPTTLHLAARGIDAQFDYSSCSQDREYVRAFHIEGGEGQTKIVFTFKGINLHHFERKPGQLGNDNMAILIKVPGLTTWMDLGRKDGDGPSKQDAFKDGAGCRVVGSKTKDLEPSIEDQIRGCQVEAHVGPSASLAAGFDRAGGPEIPILMKVILKDHPKTKLMNFEQGGPDGPCSGLVGLIQINARFDG